MELNADLDIAVARGARQTAALMIMVEVSCDCLYQASSLMLTCAVGCGDAERCDFAGNLFIGCCPISAVWVYHYQLSSNCLLPHANV